MGSTESTGRSNRTEEKEEEEPQPENGSSGGGGGGSTGAGTAVALAAAGTVLAAWGISKMISGSSDSESKEKNDAMKIKAHGMESSLPNFIQYESMGSRSIWSPPPPGRFKMNTDGGCPDLTIEGDGVERGLAGYAGILRNDRGIWVRGFQGSFNGRWTDSLTAEFHGIHKGLKLLDKLKLKGSILESDCEQAVNWVNRRDDDRGKSTIIHDCWDIINESRQLALKNDIVVEHVNRRPANQCADKLAGIAVKKQGPYMEIIYLPSEIRDLYDKDQKSLINR